LSETFRLILFSSLRNFQHSLRNPRSSISGVQGIIATEAFSQLEKTKNFIKTRTGKGDTGGHFRFLLSITE